MIEITNVDKFIEDWNEMAKDSDIDVIYIYTHGKPTTWIFEENSSTNAMSISGKNSSDEEITSFSSLESVSINGKMEIYSCNAGHLYTYNKYGKNVASVISDIVSGNIYAYDGNVSFGRLFHINNYEDRLSHKQTSYWKWNKEDKTKTK